MPQTDPALPPAEGALRLHDWGLIRARGEDAAKFLHSQLTQDVEHLGNDQARLAGFCSAKGRLQASFVVWRAAADELLLACSADLLPATLKRLSMFVLRAKCKLSDASAELALFGLAGPAAAHWLGPQAPTAAWACTRHAGGQAVRLPDALGQPRWLWAGPVDAPPPLPALDAAAWAWLEVHSGVARVTAATVEQFVPQMVNLEVVGGVSFKKGCYPGQEVVARSQYRGTLKRRSFVMHAGAALAAGQEVFSAAEPEQPAGLVVLAASQGSAHAALVELKLAVLEGGTALHAQSAAGPLLQLAAQPYALPRDAA